LKLDWIAVQYLGEYPEHMVFMASGVVSRRVFAQAAGEAVHPRRSNPTAITAAQAPAPPRRSWARRAGRRFPGLG
jgi:hypothetical protein